MQAICLMHVKAFLGVHSLFHTSIPPISKSIEAPALTSVHHIDAKKMLKRLTSKIVFCVAIVRISLSKVELSVRNASDASGTKPMRSTRSQERNMQVILFVSCEYYIFCVAYSISSVAYYPVRVGNVLGSERIYGGGLPLPSPISSLYLGPGRIWTHNLWRASPTP